jgi:mannose-1-phosphate guanylyltransferase/mannose-1-phosphate guanylyltransferase/mannose-6-phosphate isomerase
MFAFVLGHFWDELMAHEPAVAAPFESLPAETLTDAARLEPVYAALPKISIDYALMERSSSVAVIPASFAWNDVGSWDEAAKLAAAGGSGDVVEVEADGNFVDSDIPVAICGLSGIHVVVKNGKLLVCRRGESQLVKQAVEAAEERGITSFRDPSEEQ